MPKIPFSLCNDRGLKEQAEGGEFWRYGIHYESQN